MAAGTARSKEYGCERRDVQLLLLRLMRPRVGRIPAAYNGGPSGLAEVLGNTVDAEARPSNAGTAVVAGVATSLGARRSLLLRHIPSGHAGPCHGTTGAEAE